MRKDRGNRKDMEYEDAPSGYVHLYNYKEPFMDFNGGYGFQGVLLFDGASDKIQCHFCGKWFLHLSGHIGLHGLRADEYKQEVGLAPTTALIGETVREKLIANGLEKRVRNLQPCTEVSQETRDKISATLKRNVTELQNKRGTCPLQLIDRLRALYADLGRTPKNSECTFYTTLVNVYGTFEEACNIAGIPYRRKGETLPKYTKKDAVEWVRSYFDTYNKLPRYTDALKMGKKGIFKNKKLGEWKEIVDEAVTGDGKYRKIRSYQFSKSVLSNFLVEFYKHHGRNPSVSDCKRGLLPGHSRYYHHFGNWNGALKYANLV